jgi:hypothetical protein
MKYSLFISGLAQRLSLNELNILNGLVEAKLDAVAITLIPENEDDVGKWFTRFFANCVAMEPLLLHHI